MVNDRNLNELTNVALGCGFKFQRLLVWNKGNVTPSKWYMGQCEYILMLRKGKAKYINNMGDKNIIEIPNVKNKLHPTEKPVKLMEKLILNSTNENDVVFDGFMGCGSTGLACVNTNRKFIGYEINEEYFNIAKNRLDEVK